MVELVEIIKSDGKKLKSFFKELDLKSTSKDYEEFLDFVTNMQDEEYVESKDILEKEAIFAMKTEIRHRPNRLVKLVFERRKLLAIEKNRLKGIYDGNFQLDEAVFNEFDEMYINAAEILDTEITNTEKMYYYRTCLNLYGQISYSGRSMSRAIPLINEKNVVSHFIEIAKIIEKGQNFGQELMMLKQ